MDGLPDKLGIVRRLDSGVGPTGACGAKLVAFGKRGVVFRVACRLIRV